ncbi:nucleotidyltransferase substrate binding protein [Alistipes sp. OttesenSCG-928-B03]|nr:nucleotidyltransferase substrate binding protein [Alistipes sp. OttesenSCG-928-B03]
MTKQDIRWKQRFSNYKKAYKKFCIAVDLFYSGIEDQIAELEDEDEDMTDLMKEGLIQRFEYTHELAWNVMKDYAEYQGYTDIKGSRDATRQAFKMGLIEGADVWMDMIQSRNSTSHMYDEETADEIYDAIVNDYYLAFDNFQTKMEGLLNEE